MRPRTKKISADSINKILMISLSNLGDAVLTLPCLSTLKRFFPFAEIDVIVGPRAQMVFKDHPQVRFLWIYDKYQSLWNKLKWIRELKHKRYDLVIDLRHTLIPLFIFPRHRSVLIRKKPYVHSVEKHLSLLWEMGIKNHIDFIFPKRDHMNFVEYLKELSVPIDKPFLLFGAGAASPLKRWSIENYLSLAYRLKEKFPYTLIFIGGEKDRQDLKAVEIPYINLMGKTKWQDLDFLFRKAKLFITNDSGPMHFAAALGTRTLGLFGPTDPHRYRPYGAHNQILRLDLPCSPCMKGSCQIKTRECLDNLTIDQVYEAACKMLDEIR